MAIADIIRRGYANTIGTVMTRGYVVSETPTDTQGGVTLTLAIRDTLTLTLTKGD